jgi:hypothetical protein
MPLTVLPTAAGFSADAEGHFSQESGESHRGCWKQRWAAGKMKPGPKTRSAQASKRYAIQLGSGLEDPVQHVAVEKIHLELRETSEKHQRQNQPSVCPPSPGCWWEGFDD